MNDPVLTARALMCLLAVVPSLAGYYWVRYHDYFPQKSLKKLSTMLLVMLLYMGTFFLQTQVYRVVGRQTGGDVFTRILMIVQYLVASLIVFVSLAKRKQVKGREGDKHSVSKHD